MLPCACFYSASEGEQGGETKASTGRYSLKTCDDAQVLLLLAFVVVGVREMWCYRPTVNGVVCVEVELSLFGVGLWMCHLCVAQEREPFDRWKRVLVAHQSLAECRRRRVARGSKSWHARTLSMIFADSITTCFICLGICKRLFLTIRRCRRSIAGFRVPPLALFVQIGARPLC